MDFLDDSIPSVMQPPYSRLVKAVVDCGAYLDGGPDAALGGSI